MVKDSTNSFKDIPPLQIIECSTIDEFLAKIDQGHIAHISLGDPQKDIYGTTEHNENIAVLENISSVEEIDNFVVVMADSHHDFYNYSPYGEIVPGNWIPHAFRKGLLPEPRSPKDEIFPFIIVTEKSPDLGPVTYKADHGMVVWDGISTVNLAGINEAPGPATIMPLSSEDAIYERIESFVLLQGKKLIVNIDLDFGEVQRPDNDQPRTRFESLTSTHWIAKLLQLADIVITNRSPHFNSEAHYKREEKEILEFLQSQAHD